MKKVGKNKIKKYLFIIDKIENARKKNNNNWMNIVRLAINIAPEKVIKIMKKIDKYEIRIEIMKHNFNALKFWKKFNINLRSQTFIIK